ncbi:MAG: hypothetical protein LBH58_08575 [Tannerellaceae bacterium]|jgi:hypothetical protein|nr:hypothetical protein [Tannerellaceae bacterium]
MFNVGYNHDDIKRRDQTSYMNPMMDIDSVLSSTSDGKNPVKNMFANLNYRLKTDKRGSLLSFDVDYMKSTKERNVINDYYRGRVGVETPYIKNTIRE